jgi:hypothetical protein
VVANLEKEKELGVGPDAGLGLCWVITSDTYRAVHGRAAKGGPAHRITPRGARHRLACTAILREASLKTKENLIGYARYRISCKHII